MTEWVDPALQVAYRNLAQTLWMMEESIEDLRGTDHREILEEVGDLFDRTLAAKERVETILMDMEVIP